MFARMIKQQTLRATALLAFIALPFFLVELPASALPTALPLTTVVGTIVPIEEEISTCMQGATQTLLNDKNEQVYYLTSASVSLEPYEGQQVQVIGTVEAELEGCDSLLTVLELLPADVQVNENTPPTLTVPSSFTVEGNTVGGATVTFSVAAADEEDQPDPPASCSKESGDFFPLGATTVTCAVTDSGGLTAHGSFTVTVVDTTPPAINCPADITGTVGELIVLGTATALDTVDANPHIISDGPDSLSEGLTTMQWIAMDASGNSASCTQNITLTYNFLGFYQPVDTADPAGNPIVNVAEAGATIPFIWSLTDADGNYIDALATVLDYGYEERSSCAGTTDPIEEYSAAGAPDLRYDADSDQFILASQTDQGWAGSCKLFTLELSDGTTHQATFQFK